MSSNRQPQSQEPGGCSCWASLNSVSKVGHRAQATDHRGRTPSASVLDGQPGKLLDLDVLRRRHLPMPCGLARFVHRDGTGRPPFRSRVDRQDQPVEQARRPQCDIDMAQGDRIETPRVDLASVTFVSHPFSIVGSFRPYAGLRCPGRVVNLIDGHATIAVTSLPQAVKAAFILRKRHPGECPIAMIEPDCTNPDSATLFKVATISGSAQGGSKSLGHTVVQHAQERSPPAYRRTLEFSVKRV